MLETGWLRDFGLTPVDDLSPASWLINRVRGEWGRVGCFMPDGFAAYARFLHPAYRQEPPALANGRRMPIERTTEVEVRWSQVAAANQRIMHSEVQFESLVGHTGLNHHTQSGLWDTEPSMGKLPKTLAVHLIPALTLHTTTPNRCWFAVWVGWGDLPHPPAGSPTVHLPGRDYYLYVGPLSAVEQAFACLLNGNIEPPSLWWPDDRAWCVATEIDLMSTYVGGSEACVAQLLATPELEALPAKITDDVTVEADHLNPPPVDD